MSFGQVELGKADAAWCSRVVKRRAGNFYWGLRMLPRRQRIALYAVYAWMREADDLVDDASDHGRAESRVEAFAERTHAVLDGAEPEGPLWRSLRWVDRHWDLPRSAFDDMIRGQLDDLRGRPIETAADLFDYCHCVASTVGVLCVCIWGYEDNDAISLAEDRGVALQLTNILRDIGDDAAHGRCYLPADELRAHGLDLTSLVGWSAPDACAALVGRWGDEARHRYERSAALDELVSEDCRGTLRAMTAIYRELLERVAASAQSSTHVPGVSLSTFEKVRIAWRSRR